MLFCSEAVMTQLFFRLLAPPHLFLQLNVVGLSLSTLGEVIAWHGVNFMIHKHYLFNTTVDALICTRSHAL
jgi:putative flippase GtrA